MQHYYGFIDYIPYAELASLIYLWLFSFDLRSFSQG